MEYKKLFKFNLPILLLCTFLSCGQNQKIANEDIVKTFFEDVFINDTPLNEISDSYRYNSEKSDAREMFINHVKYLKSEKGHLDKEATNIKVENYTKSALNDLWLFEKKEQENIYVVSLNNKIESYVLLKNSKIVSFVYFRKGRDNPAHFIPYYKELGK